MNPWNLSNNIREPEYAGSFYPDNRDKLLNDLDRYFDEACAQKENFSPQALISPHAGYVFCGKIAASAFNQIPESSEYKRVFVIASSHQMHFEGASVYQSGNYKTPLGEITVDTKLGKKLSRSNRLFKDNYGAHIHEHSLEVQLPFLQHKLGNSFKLVPIILGTNSSDECRSIAKTLEPYFIPENLFVISTDFSHYPCYNDALKVDDISAESIVSNNPDNLLETLEKNKSLNIPNLATSLCGWTSVLTLMYITSKDDYSYLKIDYQNSGDIDFYGEKERVVGYQAIAVYKYNDSEFFISEKQKKSLLEVARRSLMSYFSICEYEDSDLDLSGVLTSALGAFVSLYEGDKLKGCIGQFAGDKPLWETVKSIVISAANDKRFDNLKDTIVEDVIIEISVLSPLKKINSIDEIVLGKHGIYIKSGIMSGTFLPQVAVKTGWGIEEFLGHCSRDKAGLGWDGWKKAEIFTYEAIIFRSRS